MDPLSKAIPSLHLGGRRADDAYALVHDLKQRLAPGCVPAFTTDGLWAYCYALTTHFGYSHSQGHLRLHLEWGRLYYHFLRPHQSLSQRTSAMRMGLTNHVWTIHEFVHTPLII